MLLSLQEKQNKTKKNTKKTNKQANNQTNQQQNTQKQQQHIVAPVYITDGDAIRQLL